MTKSPFTGKGERASAVLEVIHSHVYGPMTTRAHEGFSYFITIISMMIIHNMGMYTCKVQVCNIWSVQRIQTGSRETTG